MSQTVLVTGGTGFVAGWCIVELLRRGHAVRASVRSLAKEGDARAAVAAAAGSTDRLTFVAADLDAGRGLGRGRRRLRRGAPRRLAARRARLARSERPDRAGARRHAARAPRCDAGGRRARRDDVGRRRRAPAGRLGPRRRRDGLDGPRRPPLRCLPPVEGAGGARGLGVHVRPRRRDDLHDDPPRCGVRSGAREGEPRLGPAHRPPAEGPAARRPALRLLDRRRARPRRSRTCAR